MTNQMEEREPTGNSWPYAYLLMLALGICFYAIDHSWTAHVYIAMVTADFDGSENLTADRLGAVNSGSTVCRLVLSLVGLLGCLLPSRYKLAWSNPLLWSMACYLGWLYLSAAWSIDRQLTLFKLGVLTAFCLAAFGMSRQLTVTQLMNAVATVCCCYILLGLVAEWSLGTFAPWQESYRFTGTTHPNTQSVYAGLACLVGFFYVGQANKQLLMRGLVYLLVGIICLVLTRSRTALAATLMGLVAMQCLRLQAAQRVIFLAIALVVFATGLLVYSMIGSQSQGKLSDLAALGRTEDVSDLTGRLPLWEELLHDIAKRPWCGYGYLAFWDADRVEEFGDIFQWEIPHAHNMYLDVLLDGGAIGLMFFLIMMATALFVSSRPPQLTGASRRCDG